MKTVTILALSALLAGCYGSESNKDTGSLERMQNATVVIVSAIAAQETFGAANFKAEVLRKMDFDSTIRGTVTPDGIQARMVIPGQDNVYVAEKVNGLWAGEQRKLAFNWDVEQLDPTTYEIRRIGFDGKMDISVINGSIEGRFYRKWALDFTYFGEITPEGEYSLVLRRPLGFDWKVKGEVAPHPTRFPSVL